MYWKYSMILNRNNFKTRYLQSIKHNKRNLGIKYAWENLFLIYISITILYIVKDIKTHQLLQIWWQKKTDPMNQKKLILNEPELNFLISP